MKRQSFIMEGSIIIYCSNEILMGAAQYQLLNQIVMDGSIIVASRNLKISYQQAWALINRMNDLSPLPIVIRQKGGRNGSKCYISSYGKRILTTYAQKEIELMEFLKKSNRQLNDCLCS